MSDHPGRPLTEQEKTLVEALKKEVAHMVQKHPELQAFCSEHTYVRFLRARQWNLHKASKMMHATLEWRLQYKPHLIRFDDIKEESLTGKNQVYPTLDRHDRPLLLMRPRYENSNNNDRQVKFLIYLMERASRMADQLGSHKMTWLLDFVGYTTGNQVPLRTSLHCNSILQNHYPERLGCAVCYHAPYFFSLTWSAVKPFVDSVTQKKIFFADKGKEKKVMDPMFHMDKMEQCLGGDIPGYVFNMDQFEKDCRAFDKEVEEELARFTSSMQKSCSETSVSGSADLEVSLTSAAVGKLTVAA